MGGHRVESIGDIGQLAAADLVGSHERVVEEQLHHRSARDQQLRHDVQLWLFDLPRLKEPVVHRLERHDLRTAELDDLPEQVGLADRLHHATSGVFAKDRLKLRLAVAGDDDHRPELGCALEDIERAAFLREHEGEAKDRAGHSGFGELLLPHPSRGEVLQLGVESGADGADEDDGPRSGRLRSLGHDPRAVDVHLEHRLRLVPSHRDQAHDVLGALSSLGDCSGVQRITHQHLGATHFEGRRLHGIAHQHPQLMTRVEHLVGDRAPEKSGRTEQQDPGHDRKA